MSAGVVEVVSSDERADVSARPALLRDIAALTGGQFVPVEGCPRLVETLDLSPHRERWSERRTLWDGWGLLGTLAVLLTIEWVVRKWRYLP
jgi:hypothetical protein